MNERKKRKRSLKYFRLEIFKTIGIECKGWSLLEIALLLMMILLFLGAFQFLFFSIFMSR